MQEWSEDFSTCGMEEIRQAQIKNRAWGKELRDRTDALVKGRLAKQMSQDDYLADRNLVRKDAVEWKRRAIILDARVSH